MCISGHLPVLDWSTAEAKPGRMAKRQAVVTIYCTDSLRTSAMPCYSKRASFKGTSGITDLYVLPHRFAAQKTIPPCPTPHQLHRHTLHGATMRKIISCFSRCVHVRSLIRSISFFIISLNESKHTSYIISSLKIPKKIAAIIR